MNLLIEFYKGLDLLNMIIFWGIIIVIILVIILIVILICKNKNEKKRKKSNYDNETFEEIPIKKETMDTLQTEENKQKETASNVKISEEERKLEKSMNSLSNIGKQKKLFNEEKVLINKEENDILPMTNNGNNLYKINEENKEIKNSSPIEIPTKPYQKNVLREMSLSQTSPIGISKPTPKEDKKMTLEKDLEDALNNEEFNNNQDAIDYSKQIDREIKEDLFNIKSDSYRKTEIKKEPIINNLDNSNNEEPKIMSRIERSAILNNNELKNTTIIETNNKQNKEALEKNEYFENISTLNNESSNLDAKELLINNATIEDEKTKTETESYLEEVSRKLSNAETPNEIERTMYEIKQEEDAIISYKELMEKKDSIQTIDEEDAVISIEELMNKTSQKHEDYQEQSKLYNISEEEENDNFLKELKQFRSDL